MQGSDGKCTYWWIKKPPNIHSCYWESTSESILANWYGTQRSRDGLVVGRATTYKRGMTIADSKTTPTASNYRTGSAGMKHLRAHLPAETCSRRSVKKPTWRRVNPSTWRWNDRWPQKMMMWIPRQVTASKPAERAESIPGGKPVSAPSN